MASIATKDELDVFSIPSGMNSYLATGNLHPATGNHMAKYLMVIGGIIFLAGIIWYFFGDKLHWIGRLPGDIRVEKENFRFYFPITTMILFSVILTILFNIFKKIF